MRDPAVHRRADPPVMPAMPGRRATIPARPRRAGHIGSIMPSQDCLHIRLSDYLEARRHPLARDRASEAPADGQVPHPAGSGRAEQEGGVGDQDR